jgi:amidohydrolase
MRTTTFDMVGMALMAIVTILTSGGILTWRYLQEGSGRKSDAGPGTAGTERHPPDRCTQHGHLEHGGRPRHVARRRYAARGGWSITGTAPLPQEQPMTTRPTGPDATAQQADAADAVLAGLASVRGWQEELYRDLHAHPELPHAEHRTAATVATRLLEAGCEVHDHVGGTGVVGLLRNGSGPTVLLRADMDALPVREETGLPYASTVTGHDGEAQVPVMHACGHDVHVACLVAAVTLLSRAAEQWSGTLVAVFQPAEESADGAQAMLDGGLAAIVGEVDVAMAQHVLPLPAGRVGTRAGVVLSAADSMRITVHGRGAHGSMPQAAVDPVVLAAMIVVRLQTVVAREVAPGEAAVLTVGSMTAGSKSNVIPDRAELQLNVRTYDDHVRSTVLEAIERIVRGECQASGSPLEPEFELFDRYPLTDNDAEVTDRVARAFRAHFGDAAGELPQQSASEDFSDIPRALNAPYTYWGIGGTAPETYQAAEKAGRVSQDIPVNHSAGFAPVIQPTLDTGTRALVVAALEWLHH